MMQGLILASLALLQPFSAPWCFAELPRNGRTWCLESGICYSVHLVSLNFHKAQNACAEHGGFLSTASGDSEIRTLLTLLSEAADERGSSLFWLGLVKKAQQCTLQELPLRGFSWASAGFQEPGANGIAKPLDWLREPSKSCTMQRCAGLQIDVSQSHLKAWGLKEHGCAKASPGYICKYIYAGTCPALHPASASRDVRYTFPFQLPSAAMVEFTPPGTELSIRCPGREARFTCHLSPDGAHWEGTEQRLCSCPSGFWNPSKGDCAELTDCRSAKGAFPCLCVSRSRLWANEEFCDVPSRGGAVTAQPILSTKSAENETFFGNSTSGPGQNISLLETFPPGLVNSTTKHLASSIASDYIIILITVAVVMLVILVLAGLQVFQICFKICSCKDSQPQKAGAASASASAKSEAEASATCTNSEVP